MMLKTRFRNRLLLVALLLSGVLVLAACGGGDATEAPADTQDTTEEVPADESAEEEAPADEAAEEETAEEETADFTADPEEIPGTLPCPATIIGDDGEILQINHMQASDDAPVIRASRAGQEIMLAEVIQNDEGYFYRWTANNRTQGYIRPFYIELSDECEPTPVE